MKLKFVLQIIIILVFITFIAAPGMESSIPEPANSTGLNEGKLSPQLSGQVKKFTVGISWQDYTPYTKKLEQDINEIVGHSDGEIQFIFQSGENSPEKQISQVENFIAGKVDLIVLNPISFEKSTPAVEIANQAGIPIFTLISKVKNQEKCLTHIGSGYRLSGMIQCEVMKRMIADGNIAILEGAVGTEAQVELSKGYEDFFMENNNFNVVSRQSAYGNSNEAYMITENWLYEKKNIDILLCQNDSMALGASKAVQNYKLKDKVRVFGIDGDMEAIKAVKNGELAGTILMDSKKQAGSLLECISKVKKRQEIPKEILIPYIIITGENAENYTQY